MKKCTIFLSIILAIMLFACDDDCEDCAGNDCAIDATESVTGTFQVTYDFSDATGFGTATKGEPTLRVCVNLYDNFGIFGYDNILYSNCDATPADADDATGTITITDVAEGNYFAVVFYDQSEASKSIFRRDDPYIVYIDNAANGNGTSNPYDAADKDKGLIEITGSQTTSIDVDYSAGSFTGVLMGDGGAWVLP